MKDPLVLKAGNFHNWLCCHFQSLKPASLNGNTVSYGPYTNVGPWSSEDMSVHYENNRPFLEVTRMERTLELSMWGNIAVEETVDVRHVGAKLKGSFSRLDFQRENSGVSAVKSFKTVLPASGNLARPEMINSPRMFGMM